MSQRKRELLDQIETLKNRLQKQEDVVKRKEAYIRFLKEKLNDKHRLTDKIRELALKIGNLCNPTMGNTAEQEWDSVVCRATDGASIFVSSNILEPASSEFDDETFQRETAGEETASGSVEPSQSFDLLGQRKGVGEKLKWRINQIYTRKRRKSREQNKATNLDHNGRNHSRSSRESCSTGKDMEDFAETTTSKELLDASASEDRIKIKSEPAKSFLSSRFKKRKKLEPKKFTTEVKDFLQAGVDARRSDEIILHERDIMSMPPLSSNRPDVRLSLISSPKSSKYRPPVINVQPRSTGHPRSMSDRSLSSLAEVLPSLPSESSIIHLSSERRRGYKAGIDL